MIDSHAHLNWGLYDGDRDQVIDRAMEAGIEAFIHPGVHIGDFADLVELRQKYPGLYIAVGLHPCHADEWNEKTEAYFEEALGQAIAIGEAGLDYHHQDCAPSVQERVFRAQCRIAKRAQLPLIVHCRDAFADTLRVLQDEQVGKGVMHCYTGDAEYAAKFWELGFYIAFGGTLTFKNSKALRVEAEKIPLSQVILETDCPFLAPQKYRGQRNEPSYMTEVCRTLSEITGVGYRELDQITTTNTKALFGI